MTLTPVNKNYLGVGLMALTIIVFWTLVVPLWNHSSLLKKAVAERDDFLSSRVAILQKISDLNEEYKNKSLETSKAVLVVPKTRGVAELISTIEALTQQTGLQLIEVSTGGAENQQQELQTVFVELGLIGSYPSFTAFLNLIEKSVRLIDVFELSVDQPSTPGEQTVLSFRVKANAYYINAKQQITKNNNQQ